MVTMSKPWNEMTQLERNEYNRAKKAEKLAAAAPPDPPIQEPDAPPAEVAEPEPPAEVDEEREARRRRLLGDVSPDVAALFTDDELDRIEREAKVDALAAQKKRALDDVKATARQRAQAEHGLIAASVLRSDAERKRLAEKVRFRVTLPSAGSGDPARGRNGFRVDGRVFQVGQTYEESRAVFESLLSGHYRAWLGEIQFKTLDQHKPGNSAVEILSQAIPSFEVRHAA